MGKERNFSGNINRFFLWEMVEVESSGHPPQLAGTSDCTKMQCDVGWLCPTGQYLFVIAPSHFSTVDSQYPPRYISLMKILQLIEDFGVIGGAENVMLNLLTHLNKDEFESHVAIVTPKSIPPLAVATGATVHLIQGDGQMNLEVLRQLRGIVRQNQIDLVHSHLLKMNSYNGPLSRWCGVPGVGSVHGILPHETTPRARLFAKFAGALNTRTVVVSRSLADQYVSTYGVNQSKLVVINNGFDKSRIAPPSSEAIEEFRRQHNLQPSAPVVVAVGNVKEVKGYSFLIAAFARVLKSVPDARLFIAGEDSQNKNLGLLSLVTDLGVKDRVIFLGSFDNIALLFSVASLYVCSSLHEGFSLTTVEAMASQLSVVVTDCGGQADIVRDKADGLIVPIADSESLANAMIRLLTDSASAKKMGISGRDRAERNFSMDKFIAEHEMLYKALIASGRSKFLDFLK